MVQATTFSHPKEMLGYMIIQDFAHITEVTKLIYYDRKAAMTVAALLGTLDAKMTPFHNEMFYDEYSETEGVVTRLDYRKSKLLIEKSLKEASNMLYEKNYDAFIKGIIMWETLIASSFPKLGLVPETHEMSREEGLIEDDIDTGVSTDELVDESIGESDQINLK